MSSDEIALSEIVAGMYLSDDIVVSESVAGMHMAFTRARISARIAVAKCAGNKCYMCIYIDTTMHVDEIIATS